MFQRFNPIVPFYFKNFFHKKALLKIVTKSKTMQDSYLDSVKKQFKYYKQLGDKTFDQLTEQQLFWQPNEASNSIAIIAKHLWGNMLSRWTDFRTSDGEKTWRNRDQEFELDFQTKKELIQRWEEGWERLFSAIDPLKKEDLESIVYIRNMGHTIPEAINRQLAHYAYHVGQIVYVGRMATNDKWTSLSIPKGKSKTYNEEKFKQPKRKAHFTDEFLSHNKSE